MKVKIISDSTCDLSKELIEKFSITIVPLYVTMNEQAKKDGLEVVPEDIYEYVEKNNKLPTTSAANVGDYIEVFKYWREQGFEIVHFNISCDFSSTHHNACIAAEEVGGVYVVDSKNLSTGQGLAVLHGAEMAEQGKSAKEIFEECTALTSKIEASFVVDSIDYLYKGGRCSALAAFGANLLKLKPCIEVKDGKMSPGKKYRGNISRVMLNYVQERLNGRDDIDKHRIFITHTKCSDEDVQAVKNKILELCPDFEEILETTAGCTVTTHCGPNTLGILFIRK
ncbi:MAG: DegV family protein [Oscillospiraceae bacterium]|nr:DegV family protein [Oscillospiraceae bacterium]